MERAVFPDGIDHAVPAVSPFKKPVLFLKKHVLFFVFVFVPTIAAILYFGLFASDVYISESKFVVKSPDKPTITGLGAILTGAGFSNSGEELHGAQTFATSRDALRAVNKNNAFARAYSRPSISVFDRYDPLGYSGSFEALYKYFKNKVDVSVDNSTSISSLVVKAYTPEDARHINEELLELSEAKVNELNLRGRNDLVKFAQVDVDQAKQQARRAALAMAVFRNRVQVVDPEKQAAVQLQMISKLQDELIATRTQLVQLQQFAPANPQIENLRTKIANLNREIGAETSHMAGGSTSLATSAPEYERLQLESQVADKALASAMASLEEARNDARRKQVYVERVVQPNLPDAPLEPRRLRSIIATLILGLIAWGVVSMLFAGVKEHME